MKGIIGQIVGDSIGQYYAQKPTKDYNFEFMYDRTHPSDDSICMIAVADWLMNTDRSKDALIDKFHYWGNKYNYGLWHYDLETTFKKWINEKRREPYNSFGNGSAMRVPPVAYVAKNIDECMELAKISAEVTHNHPEGIKGAQAIAAAIFFAKEGNSKNDILKFISRQFGYNISRSYDELKRVHKFECTCQNSVPAVLICWRDSDSYEDCIRKAISLGGDTDTEGGLAGALACATKGMEIDDQLVHDVTRFFTSEFMHLYEDFHKKYES